MNLTSKMICIGLLSMPLAALCSDDDSQAKQPPITQCAWSTVGELDEHGNPTGNIILQDIIDKCLPLAKKGDKDAQLNLANGYIKAGTPAQIKKEGVHWLTQSAEQGNVGALLGLSGFYITGPVVVKSFEDNMLLYKDYQEHRKKPMDACKSRYWAERTLKEIEVQENEDVRMAMFSEPYKASANLLLDIVRPYCKNPQIP